MLFETEYDVCSRMQPQQIFAEELLSVSYVNYVFFTHFDINRHFGNLVVPHS